MATNEIRPGVPCDALPEVVARLHAADRAAPLRLDLPGSVLASGETTVLALIPAAVLSLPEGRAGPGSAALLSFAVVPFDLDRMAASDAAPGGAVPDGFAIGVDGGELTAGAVMDAALAGRLDIGAPACVTLTMQFSMPGQSRPLRSPPLRGLMTAVRYSDPLPGGSSRDDLPFLFDCHSHWYAQRRTDRPTRYWTVCHGPCAAGACHCTVEGRSGRACIGWRFCWC